MPRSIPGALLRSTHILTVLPLSVLLTTTLSPAANWPQWRGPDGSGISDESHLPTEWDPTTNILWKTGIPGNGHSSPIVWENLVFVTSAIEGEALDAPQAIQHRLEGEEFKHPDWVGSDHLWTLTVYCLDRNSGRILWDRTAYQGRVYDHRHRNNTYASATPVTDGRRVYAYFGAEGLYCYDLEGNLVWKKSLGGIGTMGMGVGTSPVLYRDTIIIVADQEFDGADSFMTALDKRTGEEVWRVKRQARATWATPLLIETRERTELVVPGAERCVSYSPGTGAELWRSQGLVSHAIPSPVTDRRVVYLSAGSQDKRALAVRLGGSGDLTDTPDILWTYEKGTAYVPSPILYQGYLYLLTDRGIITCLDAKTGKVAYENRVPVAATFKASPVAFEGKIFFSSEDGDTFVIRAGPEFSVLRTNSISEPLWASPAVSNGTILLRGREHLWAISNLE